MKYIAIPESVQSRPGCWSTLLVRVFEESDEGERRQVGSYERDYHNLMNTFHPFQKDGKWYALYSPHYTATRVMELPSCRDIGGEEPSDAGFCPVDYYVPYDAEEITNPEYGEPEKAGAFGFVAGCVWGDDASWKVEYLDLSRVEEGVIRREARFGYFELAEGLTLKEAVTLDWYVPKDRPGEASRHIYLAGRHSFELDADQTSTDTTDMSYIPNLSLDPATRNIQHAEAALEAIRRYTDYGTEPEEDLDNYVGDMLANIMLLCRHKGIDFEECLRRGRIHFEAEVDEE